MKEKDEIEMKEEKVVEIAIRQDVTVSFLLLEMTINLLLMADSLDRQYCQKNNYNIVIVLLFM